MTDRDPGSDAIAPEDERRLAAELFNTVWTLLESPGRDPHDDDRMLHAAHASRYHWGQVGDPVNLARGEWQCSRVYAVLGRAEPALHHARRTLELCERHGIGDFDLAFAYEALARGHAVAGDRDACLANLELARSAAEAVVDPEDRRAVMDDVASIRPPR